MLFARMTIRSNLWLGGAVFKMRATRYVVTTLLLFVAACSNSHQPQRVTSDQSDQSPTQVADHELQNVCSKTEWPLLGLGSMEDAGKATLGKPLHVYYANSNELSKFAGGDLDKILHKTDDVVFPVLVDGKGRLLIQIGNRDGKWTVIRDGYQDSAPALVASENIRASENIPTASIFITLSSMNESNVLLTGKAQAAAPGSSSDSIATPDLNNVIQVVQLNGQPLILTKTPHEARKTDGVGRPVASGGGTNVSAPAMYFDKAYGPGTPASLGPGAASPNPAQDFFKAIAPVAAQAAKNPAPGPG